jgi:hypothetical protein
VDLTWTAASDLDLKALNSRTSTKPNISKPETKANTIASKNAKITAFCLTWGSEGAIVYRFTKVVIWLTTDME